MMMEEEDYVDTLEETATPEHTEEEFTTNINELISEPVSENIYMAAAEYVLH